MILSLQTNGKKTKLLLHAQSNAIFTRLHNKLPIGLLALGLELYVSDSESRLPTVTTVKVPKDVDPAVVIKYCMDR